MIGLERIQRRNPSKILALQPLIVTAQWK